MSLAGLPGVYARESLRPWGGGVVCVGGRTQRQVDSRAWTFKRTLPPALQAHGWTHALACCCVGLRGYLRLPGIG